ncbi:MAG: HD-GYP domain-containing protein [Lachnospiraceae bacterium]|nr:HD-GYP domain-containing protein [Lachnospiraceae bacterium]
MKTNKNYDRKFFSGYVSFLVLYLLNLLLLTQVSRSTLVISVFGGQVPVASFTGAVSSLGNIFIILLVVLFRKPGFITSLILQILQIPLLVRGLVVKDNNNTSFAGLFGNLLTIIAIIIIYRRNKKIEALRSLEVQYLKDQQKTSRRLFEQTATALVNAVDAKDTYSHGHSIRVAEYSQRIAKELGKSEEECRRIYYAALLHDVGKIGIPNSIINKKGRLTDEEYEIIKQHPVKGNMILSSITEYPYLSIGAHYHHERYDGKGYPDHLKGDDIPEIARIISVADAYDAMSSNRSYRDAIPQQLVREEIVKGAGTQFDPKIAKIMQHLIDLDTEYRMKEKAVVTELAGREELNLEGYRSDVSDGILLNNCITKVYLTVERSEETEGRGAQLVMFDSLDGRFHDEENTVRDLCYFEYCSIWLDGGIEQTGARKIETNVTEHGDAQTTAAEEEKAVLYDIEAVKVRDHVLIRIDDGRKLFEVTVALPDSSRFAYISLTGEQCDIGNVRIVRDDDPVSDDYIARIAEEISYINVPEGDIPNVQVNGYRTDSTEGIEIKEDLKISFHSMSLPTARLVWHVPYFVIYTSKDGKIGSAGYKEYALVRLDGENWESETDSENRLVVNKLNSFDGWDVWKKTHKEGLDISAEFVRSRCVITMHTENLGISIRNTTTIADGNEKVYVALTGDQVAITNIKKS